MFCSYDTQLLPSYNLLKGGFLWVPFRPSGEAPAMSPPFEAVVLLLSCDELNPVKVGCGMELTSPWFCLRRVEYFSRFLRPKSPKAQGGAQSWVR